MFQLSGIHSKPAHHPSPSVGRWAPSSASETMAGSARLQSLPTTAQGSPSLVAKPLYQYILITLNPTKIARTRPPQPFTTCKWTRVGGPPNPSRLANGQGLGAPNPSRLANGQGLGAPNPSRLANGQGLGPPKPFTTCKWTRVGGPPNPSRLANGQGLGAPQTLHDLQMDSGWGPPQPFTTCKWTRVGGPPPTLHGLANGQGLGAPQTLHDLQMDKGCGPPQPFTTCKWTRVGAPPNPSRLANGQGLGALQPLTTWGGRAPNPSRLEAAGPRTIHQRSAKQWTGPFGTGPSPQRKT